MKRLLAALILLLSAAGCEGQAYLLRALGPIENEGEVYLYTQPFPQEADRLKFSVESISAVTADGTETPLYLRIKEISGPGMRSQRLLAWGRLVPGAYAGFMIKVSKATLETDEGVSDLLVSKLPTRMDAPFSVAARKAGVLSMSFLYPRSVGKNYAFAPVFSTVVPEKAITQLIGYASNADIGNLTVFDKKRRQVVGVVPVGREPQGLALDQKLNRAYIALSGDDQVEVLDMAAGEELTRVRLNVGDYPRELVLTPDRRTLVTVNQGSNTASFVEAATSIELNRVPTGEGPVSILMDRSGLRAFIFNRRSNNMTVLDLASRSVAATIATDAEPLRGQLNRAGDRLYVIHAGSPFMIVFKLPDFTVVNRVYIGLGMSSIKVDTNTDLIYVGKKGDNQLYVYDPFSLIPVDYIEVPGTVSYMAIDGEENTLLMLMPEGRSVAVMDLSSRKLLGVMDVGDGPYFITLMGERY